MSKAFEYRIRYCASSNISFHNEHDAEWVEWDGPEAETAQEIENYLHGEGSPINLPEGLNEALESSGFEWWPEVREVGSDD